MHGVAIAKIKNHRKVIIDIKRMMDIILFEPHNACLIEERAATSPP